MQYRTLGPTGIQVSSLALGAMNLGSIGRTTQDEATAIIDAALEAGVNAKAPAQVSECPRQDSNLRPAA
jgi:aryl-alcohol dehydrogenase-like predicted oxidoreductase